MSDILYQPYLDGTIKPVFGDESMISIQRRFQAEMEERDKKEKEGGRPLQKYRVTFEVWDSIDIEVEAFDEKDAIEIANEEFDILDFNVETSAKLIETSKLKKVM